MDKIEADYKEFLDKPEDFLAENWQDVLAVYVMKYGQDAGIKMDKSCRDDLEQIFFPDECQKQFCNFTQTGENPERGSL